MAEKKKWMQDVVKKPGALRKSLYIKEGQKIPAKKLHAAANKGGKMAKRANLALTFAKFRSKYSG